MYQVVYFFFCAKKDAAATNALDDVLATYPSSNSTPASV